MRVSKLRLFVQRSFGIKEVGLEDRSSLYILRLLVTHKMPSVKFVIVTLSLISVMLMMTVQSRHLVPFKKNLDQVLKEWNCKGPQSQLVYLGNFKLFRKLKQL